MSLGTNYTDPRKRRPTWLAAALAAVPLVALLPTGAAAPTAVAAEFDYFSDEQARVLTLSLLPGGNDDDLQGVICQEPRECQTVEYPYLYRSVAVQNLDDALRDGTTGPQYVFAYSQGARVVSLWLEERSHLPGAPTPDELGFVLMGNPGRKYGGADVEWDNVIPETEYQVIDISRQYDAASDFPDDPFNLLALLNANAGLLFVHQDYENVDIYDPANYVWIEGSTTYVYVPTENLPLLEPLRLIGLSGMADALNDPLKEIVERGYDRSYLPAKPGLPVVEPELEAVLESERQPGDEVATGPLTEEAKSTSVAAKTIVDLAVEVDEVDDPGGSGEEAADNVDEAELIGFHDDHNSRLGIAELESVAAEESGSDEDHQSDSEPPDSQQSAETPDSEADDPTASDE